METRHVDGSDKGKITLFALSTCIWCKMTKALLQKMGVGFDYIDVDTLGPEDKVAALDILKQHNPRCSFPSLVIGEETCIVGYDESKIRESVGP